MNNTACKRLLTTVLCLAMVAAMALTMTACGNGADDGTGTTTAAPTTGTTTAAPTTGTTTTTTVTPTTGTTTTVVGGPTEKGEGSTHFFFTVVDTAGVLHEFKVYTDKTDLGEALMEAGLLKARMTEFGLWLEEVAGIGCDYEKDHVLIDFYIDGFKVNTAVGGTTIEEGFTYTLVLNAC